jgi:hypothetical protein
MTDKRQAAPADTRGPVPPDVVDPKVAAVFRSFFADGRLTAMPAATEQTADRARPHCEGL